MFAIDGLPVPQRYWAILAVWLALALGVLDGAIANVALPTIAHDLNATRVGAIWVINAYQLVIAICLLPLSSLGDIFGYRRVFGAGVLIFTLASLGCAMSDSLPILIAARIFQGLGAAGIMSVNAALVRFIYPRALLGRGIGLNAVVVAVSAAAGPSVAAGILAAGPWQWLFAVNIPLGLAALLIASCALPRTPRAPHPFDWGSAILTALTFGLAIAGIDGVAHGERPFLVAGELAGAAAIGTAMVRRQLSHPSPLFPVDLLRLPIFSLSIGASVCSFIAQMLALVSLPFLFQESFGFSPVETGLLITAWPLTIAIVAPIAGRLADRISAGMLGGFGLVVFACGLTALALLPAHPGVGDIVWRMALCGFGFGLFQSPNNRTLMTTAPRARSGAAAGMLATARILGQTTGAALVALAFGRLADGGSTVTLAGAAAFAVVAAAFSLFRIGRKPLSAGEPVAGSP